MQESFLDRVGEEHPSLSITKLTESTKKRRADIHTKTMEPDPPGITEFRPV